MQLHRQFPLGFYLSSLFLAWPGKLSLVFAEDLLAFAFLCVCPLNWWSLRPYWIVTLSSCYICLNCTGHHLLGRNRHKKNFSDRQQPRAGLQYIFACIRIGQFFFLRFYPFDIFLSFPNVAVLRSRAMCSIAVHSLGRGRRRA